ncbi:hypothetical protein [Methylobacterium sp. E-046]|uniref:hypothetical protein n=1 Tax=Methylobacterium sp. E-046 TaxID=2836576 RepID=UPI001FBB23E7|nr:hypothetical protein [Methylobacterium sp. E-046]MCJ2098966.1 hypothetical protein [Methylobacterium sp. E-046]
MAPTVLTPARLSEVLAVILQEIVALIPTVDQDPALQRLANRFDRLSRVSGGSEAAGMLGAISGDLMRLETH